MRTTLRGQRGKRNMRIHSIFQNLFCGWFVSYGTYVTSISNSTQVDPHYNTKYYQGILLIDLDNKTVCIKSPPKGTKNTYSSMVMLVFCFS